MHRLQEWFRRLWYLVNRRRLQATLREEMEAHREALGRPARFGNVLRLREESDDVWRWRWLDDVGRDLRVSVRMLRKSPAFTIASLAILSVGIGINLALFQVVNERLIQPLGVKDPHTLVSFRYESRSASSNGVPYPLAVSVNDGMQALSAVLVSQGATLTWNDLDDQSVSGEFVSANWFDELGASAHAGRLLHAGKDDRSDAPIVVVLSHQLWRRAFGGQPDLIGRAIRINGQPVVAIGVVDERFRGLQPDDARFWIPIERIDSFAPAAHVLTQWAIPTVQMYGRLRPGVTAEAAKRASASALEALSRMHPQDIDPGAVLDTFSGDTRFMLPGERQRTWSIVRGAGLLTGVVLLVACLNISNLTLARAVSRVREMTIRTALGAGRWRVMRLVAMESILLGFAGAVGGGVLGAGVIAIVSAATGTSPVANVGLQWSVVLATSAAGLLAAVAIACAPAWKVGRQDLTLAARDGGERVSRGIGGARTRTWLVAGQVAGSCVLLVFAGQTLRGLERAFETQGFSVDRLVVVQAPLDVFDSPRARQIWLDEMRTRTGAQPDVEAITMVGTVPFGDTTSTTSYAAAPRVPFQVFEVDSHFFSAVSIPVISGRAFTPQESNRSVIVSKRGALGMYGTLDVVGRGFPVSSKRLTIVGVAADAQFSRIQDQTLSVMYRPLAPDGAKALMIRAKSDPARLTSPLRQIARAADGRVIPDIRLLRDDFNRGIENLRLATTIASATAAVALVLASVGIFGVVAYGVAARSKEIGIRLALGASAGALLRLLLRYTFWSLAVGMIAGLAAGWPLGRSFTQPPYYLQPLDLPASTAVGALFLAIGAIAAVVPAWRALTNDPMRGLRHE